MRHAATFILMLCFLGLSAQSLKKADKEFEVGNFSEAARNYLGLAQKNPADGHVASRLGDCYRIMNQISDAANWYEKAVSLSGSAPETLLNLGKVQKMLGNYSLARKTFDNYALAHPGVGKHFSASCEFAEKMIQTPSPFVVRSEYLNSAADEFGPAPYESHVVFSTTKVEGSNKGESHLVISSLDQNNYLKPPAALRTVFDQTAGEGPLTYSTETNVVFFAKNNFKNGYRHITESGMAMSLYYALLDGDGGWTEIKPFPFNGSGYSSGFPSLSPDGKTLFFASDRPDGYGGYDLYVSRKIGDTWTTPENLGPKVNTQGNEIAPYFNGSIIYFSSDWHMGLGGYDCFKATRTGTEWNRVFHLGAEVNSPSDDFGFVHHSESKISYFASNRTGGKGNYDLYRAIRQTDEIVVSVVDQSGMPIENASLDMSQCQEGTYRSDITGTYRFQALGGFACEMMISKSGFTPKTISLSANGEQKVLDYKVILNKEAEKIRGTIVNGVNKNPEQDVLIRATNQNTGELIETYSAPDGSYSLGLAANSVYVIRYTKVGFTDAHNRVNTGAGMDTNLLGTVNFDPVYAAIPSDRAGQGSSTVPQSNTTTTTTTTTTTNSNQSSGSTGSVSSPPNVQNGYAVQVAASDASKGVDLKTFAKLKGIGRVYVVEEKGLAKVRIGTFKSRAAADVAKRSIASQGFSEAFVVSQTGGIASTRTVSNTGNSTISPSPNPKPISVVDKTDSKPVVAEDRINNKYKVRLATYKNTSYFKPEKILSFGSIEKIKVGELTVMLLASYDSLYEAKQVMEKVRARGFKTAHVVLDKDGKLIRQR